MYVGVCYYDEKVQAFKTGRTYTYFTNLPLEAGQIVSAPVKNRGTGVVEGKRAMVVETNIPKPSFDCAEIFAMWTEG